MIKNNKWKIILSSLAILLPFFASFILKDKFSAGMKGAWYFTWIMPLVLLILNVLCIVFTLRDKRDVGQSSKILNMTFCIVPCISLFSSGIFFVLALGLDFNIGMIVFVGVGIGLILMGNYLPKSVRNRTFGIKIKWTLANDANWAATHRFGGKLWVICGIVTVFLALIPAELAYILLVAVLLAAVIPPIIYSYCFYKKQIESGEATAEDYAAYPMNEKDKKMLVATLISVGVILVAVVCLMFVGSIDFTCGEDALEINTTFGGSMELDYDKIDSVEFRDTAVVGTRVSGYGSSRLLFGWFKNDELGDYTRYTYTKSDCAIIIYTEGEILVIADETLEATKAIYDTIVSKID